MNLSVPSSQLLAGPYLNHAILHLSLFNLNSILIISIISILITCLITCQDDLHPASPVGCIPLAYPLCDLGAPFHHSIQAGPWQHSQSTINNRTIKQSTTNNQQTNSYHIYNYSLQCTKTADHATHNPQPLNPQPTTPHNDPKPPGAEMAQLQNVNTDSANLLTQPSTKVEDEIYLTISNTHYRA